MWHREELRQKRRRQIRSSKILHIISTEFILTENLLLFFIVELILKNLYLMAVLVAFAL